MANKKDQYDDLSSKLIAEAGDSIVHILKINGFSALCKRDGSNRHFWAQIRTGRNEKKYIMSRGVRHYLCGT